MKTKPHSEAILMAKSFLDYLSDFGDVEIIIKGDETAKAFRDEWKEVTIRLNGATYTFRPKPKS